MCCARRNSAGVFKILWYSREIKDKPQNSSKVRNEYSKKSPLIPTSHTAVTTEHFTIRLGVNRKKSQRKVMPKNVQTTLKECSIALNSHASKVMLTILQVRLQQYVNRELPDVQADFKSQRNQ